MKKLNPKILALVLMILSLLTAGGLAVKRGIASGSTGITDDSQPNPGGD